MEHNNGHAAAEAHVHKDQSLRIHNADAAGKSHQRKHHTLKRNQHGGRKQEEDYLAGLRLIANQNPRRHGRYEQNQYRCDHSDHQGVHKGSDILQRLKCIGIISQSKGSRIRESDDIGKNPLRILK